LAQSFRERPDAIVNLNGLFREMNLNPTISGQVTRCLLPLLGFCAFTTSADEVPRTREVATIGSQPNSRVTAATAPATKPAEWFGQTPMSEWSRLTGDWGTLRPKLEDHGLAFDGTYTMDASSVLGGGLRRRSVARGLLDLNLKFDPKATLGIEGGTFYAQYFFRHGPNGSVDTGDLQGYSNMDADNLSRAGEIWYEQKLLHDVLRVKLGQMDSNSEFDTLASAGEFLNSSAGYSPSLLNLPTYPNAAPSINVFVNPADWLYFGAGAYTDGSRNFSAASFQKPYFLGEAGLTHAGRQRLGAGKLAAGVWHDTETLSRFDGTQQHGATGFYAVAEQMVWKEKPGDASDAQGVSVFAQYAWADANVSPVAQHIGVGVSATGFLPTRDHDLAGVYWTWAQTSRTTGSTFDRDEHCLEFFYSFQVTPFFTLKPDFQWISHPGGQSAPAEASVVTLRGTVTF
jgi:carbohydrate-selective porin OprB